MVKSILRIYQVSCLIGVRRFFDGKLYRNFDAVHYTWAETNNAGRLMVIMVMMMNKTRKMMILLIFLMTLAMVYFVQVSVLFRVYREREVLAYFGPFCRGGVPKLTNIKCHVFKQWKDATHPSSQAGVCLQDDWGAPSHQMLTKNIQVSHFHLCCNSFYFCLNCCCICSIQESLPALAVGCKDPDVKFFSRRKSRRPEAWHVPAARTCSWEQKNTRHCNVWEGNIRRKGTME